MVFGRNESLLPSGATEQRLLPFFLDGTASGWLCTWKDNLGTPGTYSVLRLAPAVPGGPPADTFKWIFRSTISVFCYTVSPTFEIAQFSLPAKTGLSKAATVPVRLSSVGSDHEGQNCLIPDTEATRKGKRWHRMADINSPKRRK